MRKKQLTAEEKRLDRGRGKKQQAGRRHCVHSILPHAGIFGYNAPHRGNAQSHAERCPTFSAYPGNRVDESYVFRTLYVGSNVADPCYAWSHCHLRRGSDTLF